ncbi:DUF3606 domain-containing protein [Caulobacter sp. RL271]|uniref:DUF3606 domain-containing protein n=1 Tax=Caulobacter segnis TaxID=88688 RepID=A0ABY4ZRG8_9CAUL|nr:DUF3606 domain-containing protein [Caulobacter segnis]USQ95402.1 DUF3606 domain-containing protein [Caulobacter segnis]
MSREPFDQPSQVDPVEGEVSVRGPGATGVSLTPSAARETGDRLKDAAARAEDGHVEAIDLDDPASVRRWAKHLGVGEDALRNAVIAVGPDSEAVALRLTSARGAAD